MPEGSRSEARIGYRRAVIPPSSNEIQEAGRRFKDWLRWYMDSYPESAPTMKELARKLGVTGPALTAQFAPRSRRLPSLKMLLGARNLLGYSLEVLLFSEPPTRPKK